LASRAPCRKETKEQSGMKNFKLVCQATNAQHTTFALFDRGLGGTRANCGTITISTSDLVYFLRYNWNGDIDWNGLLPLDEIEKQIAVGTLPLRRPNPNEVTTKESNTDEMYQKHGW